MLIAMAIYFTSIYKHIYFWKKATFAAFCVALRSTMVLCSEVACSYFGLPVLLALCVRLCIITDIWERGRFIENVKKKKSSFCPYGIFQLLVCCYFVCAEKYLNNPLCTVSKSLVLNAAISSESGDLENCICLKSYVFNLLQCKKQNSSFVSFLSCG